MVIMRVVYVEEQIGGIQCEHKEAVKWPEATPDGQEIQRHRSEANGNALQRQ